MIAWLCVGERLCERVTFSLDMSTTPPPHNICCGVQREYGRWMPRRSADAIDYESYFVRAKEFGNTWILYLVYGRKMDAQPENAHLSSDFHINCVSIDTLHSKMCVYFFCFISFTSEISSIGCHSDCCALTHTHTHTRTTKMVASNEWSDVSRTVSVAMHCQLNLVWGSKREATSREAVQTT